MLYLRHGAKKNSQEYSKKGDCCDGCSTGSHAANSVLSDVLGVLPTKVIPWFLFQERSIEMTTENQTWSKFIAYLRDINPRVYVPRGVRLLCEEALKHDPENEKLLAVNEVLNIISRPESQNKSSRFQF